MNNSGDTPLARLGTLAESELRSCRATDLSRVREMGEYRKRSRRAFAAVAAALVTAGFVVGIIALLPGDEGLIAEGPPPSGESSPTAFDEPSISADASATVLTVDLINPTQRAVTFWAFLDVFNGREIVGRVVLTPGADDDFLPGAQEFRDDDGLEVPPGERLSVVIPLPSEMVEGEFELRGSVVASDGGALLAEPSATVSVTTPAE